MKRPRSAIRPSRNVIGSDEDVDGFWDRVEANLRQGRVRMVFVADQIPNTLRRIIEFLNEQMDPAEVLGVEVVQYLSEDGLQVVVPRLVGATSAAKETKASRSGGQQWDRDSFFEIVADRCTADVAAFFEHLLDFTEKVGGRLSWGKGVGPGLSGWLPVDGNVRPIWLASLGTLSPAHPTLTFYFKDLHPVAPGKVDAMVEKLNAIESYREPLAAASVAGFAGGGSFPNLRVNELASDSSASDAVFSALEEVLR